MGERNGGGLSVERLVRAAIRCLLAAACALAVGAPAPAFGEAVRSVDSAAAAGQPHDGSGGAATPSPESDPAASAVRTVRVAFPQQPQNTWTNDEGVRSGYTYEYLERIAQYAGWRYEFVPVEGSDAAALEAARALLAAGEADLMVGVMSSKQNREQLALTRESYAIMDTVLMTSAERPDDPLASVESGRPLRVAVPEQSEVADDLEVFCSQSGLIYEAVPSATVDEARAAVLEGRADVALMTDMAVAEGLRTVAHVAAHPLYFAVNRGNQELIDHLDAALARIDEVDPLFSLRLRDAYFSRSSDALVLTEADRAFVSQADPLKVGVLTNQPPYQYQENGELKGIAVDLLNTVSAKTGLEFQYVAAASDDELDELQQRGAIDMVACINYDYVAARERNLAITQPYVTASYVIVANDGAANGNIAGKRLALPSTSRYSGEFVGNVVRFPSVAECLQAVIGGQADYTYVDEYVMQYFLNLPEYRGVRVAPQTHEPRRVSFGVVRTGDGTLVGIIDQAVGSLSEMELQTVINGNVMRDRPFNLGDFVRAHPLETFALVAAVLLLVLLLVLVILFQRSRANAKTALDLKKRLRLYALCDDYFFEYDKRTDTLAVSLPDDGRRGNAEPVVIRVSASSITLDEERKGALLDLLRSGKRKVEELRLPDADGIEHWLRITVEPVDDAGRVAYAVGKMEIIDEERLEKDELVAKAERDSLTGLLNSETTRRSITRQLAALDPDEQGALLMVDIDYFKEVNDTYGHLEGDHVLVEVARILRESFRVGDVVGRLGGDEFMVYLNHVKDADAVQEKCEAVRRTVERHIFSGSSCRVTISTGSAFSKPGETFDDLYRRADQALYDAKRRGRNRCGR